MAEVGGAPRLVGWQDGSGVEDSSSVHASSLLLEEQVVEGGRRISSSGWSWWDGESSIMRWRPGRRPLSLCSLRRDLAGLEVLITPPIAGLVDEDNVAPDAGEAKGGREVGAVKLNAHEPNAEVDAEGCAKRDKDDEEGEQEEGG